MRSFFQSPTCWLAIVFAALSAGLWDWSRRLPESHWEASGTITAALPSPTAEPAQPSSELPGQTAPVLAETKVPQPTTVPAPAPTPAPTPNSTVVAAAATPAPESTPSPAASSPTPTPSDATLAGPLPANPEPAPTPATQPSPAAAVIPPASLDLTEIARQPELWPKQVLLLTSVRFPVILNGVNVGSVQVPPGRAVLLLKVNPDGTVEIGLQGSQAGKAKVNAQATDLLTRVQALAAAHKNAAPTQ